MYGNVDAAILWFILLSKWVIKECDIKIIQAESYIFYNKYDSRKLELMMSIHVENVLVEGSSETL